MESDAAAQYVFSRETGHALVAHAALIFWLFRF
jgi:hypothetical protein